MNRRDFLIASATAAAVSCGAPIGAQQRKSSNPDPNLQSELIHDPLRPQYHLVPQAGRVGDPCAPQFYNGEYHMFFHGNFGGKGWSHAASKDLMHWRHLPKAITPQENSFDAYGTFTGSVLPGTDIPTIVYSGVTKVARDRETIRAEGLREVQCIATSTDPELRTWQKLDRPIIDGPPKGIKIVGFRDPFGWKDGDAWFVGVGSGFPQTGGAVLLYRSTDARHWEYLHPLAQGVWNGKSFTNPVGSGEMWECPDFFPLGEKHVLIYSTEYITYWEVGVFDKRELRFHSERKGFLDHGAYYAPKTMLDKQNRRILWGWIQETRSREDLQSALWNGAVSLPRILSIGPENELVMEVPPEFASLRGNSNSIRQPRTLQDIERGHSRSVIHNRSGEIVCRFKAENLDCGLELLLLDGQHASPLLRISSGVNVGNVPSVIVGDRTLALNPNDGLSTLRIWLDGSIAELFIDSRQVMTVRNYAIAGGSGDIQVRWTGAPESLVELTVSDMMPISADRLTT
jgi:beta-fructofuranosidase